MGTQPQFKKLWSYSQIIDQTSTLETLPKAGKHLNNNKSIGGPTTYWISNVLYMVN